MSSTICFPFCSGDRSSELGAFTVDVSDMLESAYFTPQGHLGEFKFHEALPSSPSDGGGGGAVVGSCVMRLTFTLKDSLALMSKEKVCIPDTLCPVMRPGGAGSLTTAAAPATTPPTFFTPCPHHPAQGPTYVLDQQRVPRGVSEDEDTLPMYSGIPSPRKRSCSSGGPLPMFVRAAAASAATAGAALGHQRQ